MQCILGYHGLHGWNLSHLMPLRLRILSQQCRLTAGTALRLDGDDASIDRLAWPQRPHLSLMTDVGDIGIRWRVIRLGTT